jgi:hypothetical protein
MHGISSVFVPGNAWKHGGARVLSLLGVPPQPDPQGQMSKRANATCSDCYFRRAGLCALPGETTCPTFRASTAGALAPPPQPQLVPRTTLAAHAAA